MQRRSAASLLFLAATISCAEDPQPEVRAPHHATSSSAKPPPAPPKPPPFVLADALKAARVVAGPFHSQHGPGELEATVLSTDPGPYPPGKHHADAVGSPPLLFEKLSASPNETSAVFAMRRDHDAWEFFVFTPSGELDGRDTSLCARCHAEAPHEGVFGPPRPLK